MKKYIKYEKYTLSIMHINLINVIAYIKYLLHYILCNSIKRCQSMYISIIMKNNNRVVFQNKL